MESLINSDSKICRLCSNTNNLIDLLLPENDVYIENLSSFVFVEVRLHHSLNHELKECFMFTYETYLSNCVCFVIC